MGSYNNRKGRFLLIVSLTIIALSSTILLSSCNKPRIDDNEDSKTTDTTTLAQTAVTDLEEYLLKYPDDIPDEYNDENRISYSYSEGRDENGYWIGLVALDNISPFEYSGFNIPYSVHNVSEGEINSEVDLLFEEFEPYTLTDDEVLKHFGESRGWSTINEMRGELKKNILHNKVIQYLLDYVDENVEIKVPDEFMSTIEQRMIEFKRQDAANKGMTFKEYVEDFFEITDGIRGVVREAREGNIESAEVQILFQSIAEDLGVIVTEADMKEYYGVNNIKDEEIKNLEELYGLPYLKQQAMVNVVTNYIIDNAVLLEE